MPKTFFRITDITIQTWDVMQLEGEQPRQSERSQCARLDEASRSVSSERVKWVRALGGLKRHPKRLIHDCNLNNIDGLFVLGFWWGFFDNLANKARSGSIKRRMWLKH